MLNQCRTSRKVIGYVDIISAEVIRKASSSKFTVLIRPLN